VSELAQRLYAEAQDNPDSLEWKAAERVEKLVGVLAEWLAKTEWVQKTSDWQELGLHRADVLKRRIEILERENAELRKQASGYSWPSTKAKGEEDNPDDYVMQY
jgi:hypothetical protein